MLNTHGRGGVDASHIPFLLGHEPSPLGVLHAHVARANPVWQEIATGDEVPVVFAWRTPISRPIGSKQDFHKQVPAWSYLVAHAYDESPSATTSAMSAAWLQG